MKACRRGHPMTPENRIRHNDGHDRCRRCNYMSRKQRYERDRLPSGQIPRALALTPLGDLVTAVPPELFAAGYGIIGVAEVWP